MIDALTTRSVTAARYRRRLAWLVVMLLAGGCAAPPKPAEPVIPEAARAQQAAAAERFAAAAGLWEQAAARATDPQRQVYRLRAAQAWLAAGEPERSRAILGAIEDGLLPSGDLAEYGLLQAELALADADAEQAEFYLQVARPGLEPEMQTRYRELRARIDRLRSDPASYALATAAGALAAMGPYDTAKGVALLQLLEDVPSGTLERVASGAIETPALDGWPQLALLMRRTLIAGIPPGEAAAAWAAEHPGHAVSPMEFTTLASVYGQLFTTPPRVAVLLPFRGGLGPAATAIRDGLLSAYLENPRHAALRFYATGDDPQSAVSAYFEAMSAGAQWIIGPLRRESVQALAGLGSLGAPALVLNELQDPGSAAGERLLFRMSLSQEAEAHAVARKALELGHGRALVLAADNSWGGRMESAFVEAFEAGGGRIVVANRFPPLASDHSPLLTEALKINDSRDRKNRLQATLGLDLSFEPTRRDDFDFIFLAASPEQGRQIRPQLRFHDAGDKPVFAMGRIFSGEPDPVADQDLNGISFPATAWQQSAGRDFPMPGFSSLRNGSLGHLFALGVDAWNLIPWLPLLQKDPDLAFPGATGSIRLSRDGSVLREPAWTEFSAGRPVRAQWSLTGE